MRGFIGYIGGGSFAGVISAGGIAVDGDIGRPGEGGWYIIQHVDGLYLIRSGVAAVINEAPQSPPGPLVRVVSLDGMLSVRCPNSASHIRLRRRAVGI